MDVFITALASETESVVRALTGACAEVVCGRTVTRGILNGRNVAVVQCGVGKTAAASAAQLAVDRLGATRLLSVGTAGGLKRTMAPLGVYTVNRAVQYDFDLAALNQTGVGVLNERTSAYFELEPIAGFPVETVATGDRFSNDVREIAELVRHFDAGVREMELAAVAHVGELSGVPVQALKVITNVAGNENTMTGQFQTNLNAALEKLTEAVRKL